jgi:hypothetical protein
MSCTRSCCCRYCRCGKIWVVYIVVLAQSCLQQFFRAAEQSLMPQLVEPSQLVTANALNSQTNDIARLIGAALGGVLAAFGGLAPSRY